MLEKETDIQGIVNITPDHQHGSINIAALRKGKAAISHKPVASVLHEVRRVAAGGARQQRAVASARLQQHARPAHARGVDQRRASIGTVREVHNWTNRPFWPQGMQEYHKSGPAGAGGLQLDAVARPRARSSVPSRATRSAVYRGWYAYGTGCLGDMGHYSALAAVSHPRISACRSSSRRGRTTTRSSTSRTSATAGTCRGSAFPRPAPSAGAIRRPPTVRRSTRSGTTAA